MAYAAAGIQMFMEKLKQLINCKDIPSINIPIIIHKRLQFRLLYEQLTFMIEKIFNDQQEDVPELNDLKKRFMYAAEEAEYIIDLFLSGVRLRNSRRSPRPLWNIGSLWNNGRFPRFEDFKASLNLDDVGRSFESIKVEFMSITIDNMKLDSSSQRLSERRLNQSAAPRSSLLLLNETIVGIDHDAELIRDKLVEDQKKVDVVSIVGMGGIGKTTLATKVFDDHFIKYHFPVRVWVTVSQTYDKRDTLIQILESIRGQLDLEKDISDSRLRELVHKHLIGKRYLIVIDDIWHIETWDKIKLFFPHDNTGSRILLTSRLNEVAKHANSVGLIHNVGCLNEERGWDLLRKKVFGDINAWPEWSKKPGMKIVKHCKGLPLSLVVIAGILAKEAWNKELWTEIADRTSKYIVGEQNGCLETLALSYNHLPFHMRVCFLYLGGFPEDYKFNVQWLISLWVAEGFVPQAAGNGSLEDTAESYLMDLIDRNLVTVSYRRKSDGAAKAFKVHDLVRELCLRKAKEEGFILKIQSLTLSSNVMTPPYKPVRMFVNKDTDVLLPSAQNLRSILLLSDFKPSTNYMMAEYFRKFTLLRVLDLQNDVIYLNDFPKCMELLVHLRYLAIQIISADFPSSICNLWSLQTLIYITSRNDVTVLPRNISDLVNLRNLWNFHPSGIRSRTRRFMKPFSIHSIEKPMNLRAISNVHLGAKVGSFQKCFPYIKEIECTANADKECDFKSLTCLETLKLTDQRSGRWRCSTYFITFPATLRALTLYSCRLPWSHMSIIQSLPNLQILKLRENAFEGSCWNMDEQEFQQLKLLRLEYLDIKQWEASAPSFPCLRRLEIYSCEKLEEIPLEIGDIPTLELIKIYRCSESVNESVRRIEKVQNDSGNHDLKIELERMLSSWCGDGYIG